MSQRWAAPDNLKTEEWKRLVELAELRTFVWNIKDGVVEVDAYLGDLVGTRSDQAIDLSGFLRRVHPCDRAELRALLLFHARSDHPPSSTEYRLVAQNGTMRWFRTRIAGSSSHLGREGTRRVMAVNVDISADKQATLETEATAAQAEETISSLPGAIYTRTQDPAWMFLELSEGFEDLTGYSAADLLGQKRSFEDIVFEPDRSRISDAVAGGAGSSSEFSVRYRILRADGAHRWVLDRGRIKRDSTGRVKSVTGVLFDVTDEVRRQERLQLLETVVEHANDCVLVTEAEPIDGEGPRIVYVNEAFEKLTGYTREEAIGKTPRMLQGPDSGREALLKIRSALEAWEPVRVEVLNYRKDGTQFWSELSITPLADESGWYTHFVSVQRDISERKIHEQRLSLLESAVIHAKDGILVTEATPIDEPGPRIVYVNEAFTQMTGYSSEEAIGQTPRILQGPESDGAALDAIRQALDAREPVQVEVLNYRKDETKYWAELSIVPVTGPSGRHTHWVSVQRDVTDRKAKEDRFDEVQKDLRSARDAAEQASRAKGAFLAAMSHELRSPLNGILDVTSLLLQDGSHPEQQDQLETIRGCGEDLMVLIDDILDFSQGESGGIELDSTPYDLDKAVESVLDVMAPKARGKGLKLHAEIALDVPYGLLGDPSRMEQIIVNLVSNAVKFTEAGEVAIVVDRSDDDLFIEVRDTGIGIAQERLSRLFRPFGQSDAPESRRHGGSGLGLAICKQLVELMKGSIQVQSTIRKGTTFTVQVPLTGAELATTEVETALWGRLAGRTVAARVADPHLEFFLRRALGRLGARWTHGCDNVDFLFLSPAKTPFSAGKIVTIEVASLAARSPLPNVDIPLRWPIQRRSLYVPLLEVLGLKVPSVARVRGEDPNCAAGLRVLVADDNPVNQKVVRNMLGRLDIDADVAANGKEAVEMAMQHRYDLVLMDLHMPLMDGFTAAKCIRARLTPEQQPMVVALTASEAEEDSKRCQEAGMDDRLIKPLRLGHLKTVLGSVTSGARNPD